MISLPFNSALLIIDVQKGFDDPSWGVRNNPGAEQRIGEMLEQWRAANMPIVHVQHMSTELDSPLRPGQGGNAFKDFVEPREGERVERKNVNSAFIGTTLESFLRQNNIDTIVIVGISTDHCVSTTTRMAGNLGFNAFVVSDATATFNRTGPDGKTFEAQQVHDCALASLHNEFATVVDSHAIHEALRSKV